jgi:Cupin domain
MRPGALPSVRRVVTAIGKGGRSFILEDGPPPVTREVQERPGFRASNLWRTDDTPAPIHAEDCVHEHHGVMPPARGTVLRVIDYPPRHPDPEERKRQAAATFQRLYPDMRHDVESPRPGMHTTLTLDYAIVLKGTITALMDDGECDLHAGDILIQRGTSHGWENRTDEFARVAYVLIDGR